MSTLLPHPYDGMSRAEAERFYFDVFLPPGRVPDGWTGNVEAGDAGTLDPAYRQAIIDRVNAYRVLAGLPGVSLDLALSEPAQKAALMMSANRTLSHTPDPSFLHYSAEGAASAGRSNLALGAAGTDAIDLYVDEGGELGHRRWVLYPARRTMGVGAIPTSDGYPAANVLDVIHDDGAVRSQDVVSWPPPGALPVGLLPTVWSLSVAEADFSAAQVSLVHDGSPVPIDVLFRTSPNFGDPTIAWSLADTAAPVEADDSFEVIVSNLLVDGESRSYTYTTQVFDPFSVAPPNDPGGASPGIGFSSAAVAGPEGVGFVEFRAVRDGDISQPLSMALRTQDGSATDGADYEGQFVLFNMAAGQRDARVRIALLDDTAQEPDESFSVELIAWPPPSNGNNAPLATMPVTILDDDGVPSPIIAQDPPDRRTSADFDGDGRTDFASFRVENGVGQFTIERSSDGQTMTIALGGPGDFPVVGDYDGDGKADAAVFGFQADQGFSTFRIRRSSDGQTTSTPFGGPFDYPIAGDYDGDGITDIAVYGYSPANGFARFGVIYSGGQPVTTTPFGGRQDSPVAGDYDGDGIDDLAVFGFSPANGSSRFGVIYSSGKPTLTLPFGGADDRPLQGDFDGDGITDLAVYGYSPSEGFSRFGVMSSSGQPTRSIPFGGRDDAPAAGDFDGDGITDLAVYGYSPANGFARFGVVPSSGQPVIVRPAGSTGSIGLPPFSGLFPIQSDPTADSPVSSSIARLDPRSVDHLLAMALLTPSERDQASSKPLGDQE